MPTLLRAAPYLPVPDVSAAAIEYESRFGFRTTYLGGEPPEFAIVTRDGLSLMLRQVPDASVITPNVEQGGSWDVFFWTDDARGLFEELVGRGASIVYGPTSRPHYRMLEFAVRDSLGHVLGFGQEVG